MRAAWWWLLTNAFYELHLWADRHWTACPRPQRIHPRRYG